VSDITETSNWRLDWPVSGSCRVATARLKASPEAFRVCEELDGFPSTPGPETVPSDGEHLCLYLEKTGDNSEYVARQLAILAGCRPYDVGFCGLKDRHAITRQWFSLYRPGQSAEDRTFIDGVSERWPVLSFCRHTHKLRRGDHRGNRFVITLNEVTGSKAETDEALQRLKRQGAPNYFGSQRFGINGGNLDRAAAMDPAVMVDRGRSGKRGRRGKKPGGGERSKHVMYFSAARSWLFNEVLACRVSAGNWLSSVDGEPGLAEQIIPTGPLWGDGGTSAGGQLADLEWSAVDQVPELVRLFSTTRMKPERRSLVARPDGLSWQWLADDSLELTFFLLPGQYATAVLSDIFELEDMSLSEHKKHEG
jgi:tRNA pseudouridine13 synthase